MPSFSDVIRDHNQLKSTITQIEQMKNRIKANERQMFPPAEFSLRSAPEAVGMSDFGMGAAAGDQAQQFNIITTLNALLQSVSTNYLSPYQSLQFWVMILPKIPNNSVSVTNNINELSDILNSLQTNSKFKPTEVGAITSLLRRIIVSAEQLASPEQPIISTNFNNAPNLQNIIMNPNGENNNQPAPPAVQEIIAEPRTPAQGQVNQASYAMSPSADLDTSGTEEFSTPKLDLPSTSTETDMNFGSPQPVASQSTPKSATQQERTQALEASAKKVREAVKKNKKNEYIQKIENELNKYGDRTLAAIYMVGSLRQKDLSWLLADDLSENEINQIAENLIQNFVQAQQEFFTFLTNNAEWLDTPSKTEFNALAQKTSATPQFIYFLLKNDVVAGISPMEVVNAIFEDEDDSAGITQSTPPRIEENVRGIEYASPARVGERIYGKTPPGRFSELSQADTPSRDDVIAQVIAKSSPEPPAASGRPDRDRKQRGTYNPSTGRDQFGKGLKPVTGGRKTIKSAVNQVNDLYHAYELGNKSKSVKDQIKSNLEFLHKKNKVGKDYLDAVFKKLKL